MKKTKLIQLSIPVLAAVFIILPVLSASAGTGGLPRAAAAVNAPGLLMLDGAKIEETLGEMKNSGASAARIFVSFSGKRQGSFHTEPGVYDEEMLKKLDRAVASASKNNMRLILVLMDSNPDYGGKEVYRQWAGGSNDDIFFKDRISIEYFKGFINMLLTRKNTATGAVYASDPAIMALDLCNEAQNSNDPDGAVMHAWVREISGFIRSKAPNIPIGMGMKEANTSAEGYNDYDIFMLPSVDFALVSYSSKAPLSLSETAKNYIENTGKPVLAVFSGENPAAAAEGFFRAGGTVFMLSPGEMKKEGAAAAKAASAFKTPFRPLPVSGITAKPSAQSAVISASIPGAASAAVYYGDKTPLRERAEMKMGKEGVFTANLTDLRHGTAYSYLIRARSKDSSVVTKASRFTTTPLRRISAVEFSTSNNFIKARGTKFYDGTGEYKYVGTSNYYMRNAGKKTIDYIFSEAKRAGFKVIRVGSNGEAISMDKVDKQGLNRFFRIGPDYFNEAAYKEFDYVMDSAARHGTRVIIHFSDNWEYYGGAKVYAQWAGHENKNMLWTDPKANEYYRQTIKKFITRKNTVNGKLYRDDPAIFAWDLMNEPRNENDPTGEVLNKWIEETADYIKSLDPNHMVTTGSEGYYLGEDGTHYSGSDFIGGHKPKSIDFCTYHIYPTYEHNSYAFSTVKWLLDRWISDAHNKVGKPVVMEEYGIASNNPAYPKAKWINDMTGYFFEKGGNGVNYWFFIDPSYTYGDGFEVNPTETEYMNVFIKHANRINKNGY